MMRYSALVGCVAMAVLFAAASQAHEPGSNKNPLSFGDDQTIVDLDKVVWEPLDVDGLTPGAEIAVIRGDLAKDHSESVVRLPPPQAYAYQRRALRLDQRELHANRTGRYRDEVPGTRLHQLSRERANARDQMWK